MLVSLLSYLLLWGLLQLRRNARSLFAAAVVYAYPAGFAVVMAGVMFVHRLHVLVFGGGAQASSNDARQRQLEMGIPKIFANPIGHGAGSSGDVLGYAKDEFITVDNYWLTISLDYGVLGIIMYVSLFVLAIIAGTRCLLQDPRAIDTREKTMVIPLICCMAVFLVIKGVLSQEDNHALVFSLLGLLVGLIFRISQTSLPPLVPKTAATERGPLRRAHVGQRAPVLANRSQGPSFNG